MKQLHKIETLQIVQRSGVKWTTNGLIINLLNILLLTSMSNKTHPNNC